MPDKSLDISLRSKADASGAVQMEAAVDRVVKGQKTITATAGDAAKSQDKLKTGMEGAGRAAQVLGFLSMGSADSMKSAGEAARTWLTALQGFGTLGNVLFLIGNVAAAAWQLGRRFSESSRETDKLADSAATLQDRLQKLNETKLDALERQFSSILNQIESINKAAQGVTGHLQAMAEIEAARQIAKIRQQMPPGPARDAAIREIEAGVQTGQFRTRETSLQRQREAAEAAMTTEQAEASRKAQEASSAQARYQALLNEAVKSGLLTREQAEAGDFTGLAQRADQRARLAGRPAITTAEAGLVQEDPAKLAAQRREAQALSARMAALPGAAAAAQAAGAAATPDQLQRHLQAVEKSLAEIAEIDRKLEQLAATRTAAAETRAADDLDRQRAAESETREKDARIDALLDEISNLQNQITEINVRSAALGGAAAEAGAAAGALPDDNLSPRSFSARGRPEIREKAREAQAAFTAYEAENAAILSDLSRRIKHAEEQLKNFNQ